MALGFLTNAEALLINAEATDPRPLLNPHTNTSLGNVTGWRSDLSGNRVAVALVNIGQDVVHVTTAFADLGLQPTAHYDVLDVFANRSQTHVTQFSSTIVAYEKHNKHPAAGAVLYLLSPSAGPIQPNPTQTSATTDRL